MSDAIFRDKPQAARRKALCRVIVNGDDVTARLDPHLISITVVDKIIEESTCAIELDDRDGRLAIPPDDAWIEVSLGWQNEAFYLVFTGRVDSVESGFGRKAGGRRLWIDGVGTYNKGQGRSPIMQTWGEGAPPGQKEGQQIPLSQVLQDAASAAGMTISVAANMGQIKRDFWQQSGESFFHLGARLADELGGRFKVAGTHVSFTDVAGFKNSAGEDMGEVHAVWGDNLLEWRIKPYAGRPQWLSAVQQFYDPQISGWDFIEQSVGGSGFFGNALGKIQLPNAAPNSVVGSQVNTGLERLSQESRGTGWVTINGEPQAHAGMKLIITGAREGVDGDYSIDEAHHRYSRNGYVTQCKLNIPAG